MNHTCADPKLAIECPRCRVYRHERIPGKALRCLNCHVEWNIPKDLKRFRHMHPARRRGTTSGPVTGCEQAIHDTVLLAETEAAAMAFVRWVHGTDHFVIPVIDGKDYG
jgi:hypothetical protein